MRRRIRHWTDKEYPQQYEDEYGSQWVESNHPMLGKYETRPKDKDKRCYTCKHAQWRYYHFTVKGSNYHDQYKTTICTAGRATICINGFIQPEEFSQL